MPRYMLINSNKEVENIIAWDGVSPYEIPGDHSLEPCINGVGVGYVRDENGIWNPPISATDN